MCHESAGSNTISNMFPCLIRLSLSLQFSNQERASVVPVRIVGCEHRSNRWCRSSVGEPHMNYPLEIQKTRNDSFSSVSSLVFGRTACDDALSYRL